MGSAQGRDLAPFFGHFIQSEKLSEIKPPLPYASVRPIDIYTDR